MPRVLFVGDFFTGEFDLGCIDHNDVIATIIIGSEIGFMFSSQYFRDLTCQPPNNLVACVDQMPQWVCKPRI